MADGERSPRFTLRKTERLSSKRALKYLFEHGSSFRVGMLKFFYAFDPPQEWIEAPLSIAIAVPKRSFKRAVDRNLLKRRIREAWRRNKYHLQPELKRSGHILVVLIKYNRRDRASFVQIEQDVKIGLEKLAAELDRIV